MIRNLISPINAGATIQKLNTTCRVKFIFPKDINYLEKSLADKHPGNEDQILLPMELELRFVKCQIEKCPHCLN
jgi:hypothetical protein